MSVSESTGSLKSQLSKEDSPTSKSVTDRIDSVVWSGTPSSDVSVANRLLTLPLFPSICFALVMLATGLNTVDLDLGTKTAEEQVGLDFQVAIKLAIACMCGMIGLWGVIQSKVVRQSLLSIPGLCLVAMSAMLIAASIVAHPSTATVSRVAAIVNFGYLLFMPTVMSVLGLRKLMISMLIAMVAYMIAAWFIFLALPEIGVFVENLGEHTRITRMGGLGHPNSVARAGVWAALLSIGVKIGAESRGFNRLLPLIILLGILTAIATVSRTAMLAGTIGAGAMLFDRVFSRNGLALALASIAMLVSLAIGMLMFSGGDAVNKKLLSIGTKTGEVEELSSATGRTEIWAETIRLIGEQPITGYGLNSAPMLLEDYSHHAHNLVLHVALSGGLIAGISVIALLIWTLIRGLPSNIPMIRGVSAFILVSGIVEDTAVDTFASPTMLLWITILLYPSILNGLKVARSPIESNEDSPYNETSPQLSH